jgi:uncharacterized Zn finger protein
MEGDDDDRDAYDDDETDDAYLDDEEPHWSGAAQRTGSRARSSRFTANDQNPKSLRAIVEAKPHAQLVALVLNLAASHPALAKQLQDESLLASGDAAQLIDAARREIRSLTAKQSWWRHWERRGSLPNFDPLREKFERLQQFGLANHLLELGVELLQRGIKQVEQSDDDGHVSSEIQSCLEVVFDALPESGLAGADQLLFAIYAVLVDDYNLCESALAVLDGKWSAADWSQAADALQERLNCPAKGNATTANYRRKRLVDFAVQAFQGADREDEVLSLVEREAQEHKDYERLINVLLERKDWVAAESWLQTALANTDPQLYGLVAGFRRQLVEIATRRKDWSAVAAHAAEVFFERPAVETFREAMQAADKAGCLDAVRAGALRLI